MKIELAHDFIAKKIYEEASIDDKARARATKFLHERYQHYLTSKTLLLTERDLIYINAYIKRMDLDKGELEYIQKSKKIIKKSKLMARFKDASIVALACMILFSSWGLWERQRFSNASKHLATAKDSIDVLLRQGMATENSLPVNDGLRKPTLFFTTIHVTGTIKNEQEEPINAALIEVMGAEVYTQKDGSYELHLVLPPQKIGQNIPLTITKTNYLTITKTIDSDNTSANFDLVLMRE